ncbi:MAG: winged helix-turn-helix domain-containing protein [Candidatus Bipolaricaulia bacterium]
MSPKSQLIWALIGFVVVLSATFGSIYFYRFTTELKGQYVQRGEEFADGLARQADLYLEREEPLGVLAKWAVMGGVLYAQVVYQGQIVAEDRATEALNVRLLIEDLATPLSTLEDRLPNGNTYLDVLRQLPSREGYVRIGVSLASVDYQIRNEALLISMISLGFIGSGILLSVFLARMMFQSRMEPIDRTAQAGPNGRSDGQIIEVGRLVIDDGSKEVQVGEQLVNLSPKEYELMKLLASEPGKVFSSEEILDQIWTENDFASAEDVKKYIYLLRQKIEENPEEPQLILTIRGFGYKLNVDQPGLADDG